MVIGNQQELTAAVLAEAARTPDARLREILTLAVTHLHAFVREARHNMRPAHLHFLVIKPGFKAQFSQVYSADDPYIDDDVQFGVTKALVAHCVRHLPGGGALPPAADVTGPWYTLTQRFMLQPGEPRLPPPPVTGNAEGARPTLTRLERRG